MRNSDVSGWRGIALIAVVYIYFLIFAQFAFLARLAVLHIGGNEFKLTMAAMAMGGIFLSLLGPGISTLSNPGTRLRIGLAVSAIAALFSLSPLVAQSAVIVAFLIGSGLGISTVTLVTNLDLWIGKRRAVLKVGIGTGLAYAACNVPAFFTATPQYQALVAAALCIIGIALPLDSRQVQSDEGKCETPTSPMPFLVALFSFLALIWLDSAAFYIIQHNELLKAGTWLGSVHLWLNAALHFAGAIFAALLLQRGKTSITLVLAFGTLAFACLLLRNPHLILSASLFYPLGVSLYSVALIAYPSFLSQANSRRERGRLAGFLYAVAGWIGSALGIGMGQNLGHIPTAFVAIAALAVLLPPFISICKGHTKEIAVVGAGVFTAILIYRLLPAELAAGALTPAERGRQVYISEGCISCHSQYVRPNSPDSLMWGPLQSLDQIHAQHPPLIGNRRQGPDLAEVGVRRSPLWLKAHLMNPMEFSYHSPMPSYAFLFQDQRGEDLVTYLAGLRGPGIEQQIARETAWQPDASAWQSASLSEGEQLYSEHCATCHDSAGAARNSWRGSWSKVPMDTAALRVFAQTQSAAKLAQISKFGIPGTDMPGHEYLDQQQLASVAAWLKSASPAELKTELPERKFQ